MSQCPKCLTPTNTCTPRTKALCTHMHPTPGYSTHTCTHHEFSFPYQPQSFTHTHTHHPHHDQSTSHTHTPPKVSLPHPKCFLYSPTDPSKQNSPPPTKETPKALGLVCLSSRYLNSKTFDCDFLSRLMSRGRLKGARMAGESNYTQIFSLLIRDSFSRLLWLRLNLFLMRCGLSRSER